MICITIHTAAPPWRGRCKKIWAGVLRWYLGRNRVMLVCQTFISVPWRNLHPGVTIRHVEPLRDLLKGNEGFFEVLHKGSGAKSLGQAIQSRIKLEIT